MQCTFKRRSLCLTKYNPHSPSGIVQNVFLSDGESCSKSHVPAYEIITAEASRMSSLCQPIYPQIEQKGDVRAACMLFSSPVNTALLLSAYEIRPAGAVSILLRHSRLFPSSGLDARTLKLPSLFKFYALTTVRVHAAVITIASCGLFGYT